MVKIVYPFVIYGCVNSIMKFNTIILWKATI